MDLINCNEKQLKNSYCQQSSQHTGNEEYVNFIISIRVLPLTGDREAAWNTPADFNSKPLTTRLKRMTNTRTKQLLEICKH